MINSSRNTLGNVISGATVNLLSASESPVQVTIVHDNSEIEASGWWMTSTESLARSTIWIRSTRIQKSVAYSWATRRLGAFGSELFGLFNFRSRDVTGRFAFPSQVGVRVAPGGNFQFNKERFQAALAGGKPHRDADQADVSGAQ